MLQPSPVSDSMLFWQTTRFRIELAHPRVMGIVNVTPDSFSDGGRFVDNDAAIRHCEQLLDEGADLLDIGGQSTRPGSSPVSVEEELARVMPVLDEVLKMGCPVSIDTDKPAVMAQVLARGADIINDIGALRVPGALDVVAAHPLSGICLMHMRGDPATMQQQPHYDDVLDEVSAFLGARLAVTRNEGIDDARIVLDPGIGFGKSVEHNLDLLRNQSQLLALGRPLLVGWSRKSTLGVLTGRDASSRQSASVAASLASALGGARILRVHDVAATVDALTVWKAVGLPADNLLHSCADRRN